MKKRLLNILSLMAILGAVFCFLYRPDHQAQGSANSGLLEKPYWKRDRYFIPKGLLRDGSDFRRGEEVSVVQASQGIERCLLGHFLVMGIGKRHLILQGMKAVGVSKLEQHLLAINHQIYFEVVRAGEATVIYQRCKQWMLQ